MNWYTNRHCHLGDIIAIIQRLHGLPGEQVLYGNRTCRCGCGRVQKDTMRQILSLLDTTVQYGEGVIPVDVKEMIPTWEERPPIDNIVYARAKCLPSKREDIVTIQLDPVTRDSFRALSPDYVGRIMNLLKDLGITKSNLVNLGDGAIFHAPQPLWGCSPVGGTVVDKLQLIARAKFHLSIDSGTAHLAAMTETPFIAICPEAFWNRYATQPRWICCKNSQEVLHHIEWLWRQQPSDVPSQ